MLTCPEYEMCILPMSDAEEWHTGLMLIWTLWSMEMSHFNSLSFSLFTNTNTTTHEHNTILSFRTELICFISTRIFVSSFLIFLLHRVKIWILDIFSSFLSFLSYLMSYYKRSCYRTPTLNNNNKKCIKWFSFWPWFEFQLRKKIQWKMQTYRSNYLLAINFNSWEVVKRYEWCLCMLQEMFFHRGYK